MVKIGPFVIKRQEPPKKENVPLTPSTPTKVGTAVICTSQNAGSTPSSSFTNQVKVFKKVSVVRESIVQMSMEVVGTGLFTSGNDAYTLELPKPKAIGEGKWTAKQAIDYWNKENNLDEAVLTESLDLCMAGNSFWLITPTGLQPIPLEAIQRIVPHSNLVPITKEYDLELVATYNPHKISWGKFVHFRSLVTTSSAPLGTGVISGLIEVYDDDMTSLVDAYCEMLDALSKGFKKFANPNEIYSFKELSDEALGDGTKGVSKQVKELPSSGSRLSVNTEAAIISSQSKRDTGWDRWIEFLEATTLMSLGNPSLRASVESGFTEASIRGAINLFRRKIQAFRRCIKRLVEKMWEQVLKEYGFNPDEAQIKLNFGAEEIEFTPADLVALVNARIISPEEARGILREKAKLRLESQKAPDAPKPEPVKPTESETTSIKLKEKKMELVDKVLSEFKKETD